MWISIQNRSTYIIIYIAYIHIYIKILITTSKLLISSIIYSSLNSLQGCFDLLKALSVSEKWKTSIPSLNTENELTDIVENSAVKATLDLN